ncbi:MAG TPA: membrane protein insertion efficiency factor YidD [Nocardia sp.]|uniref:membrane protein insertion efficiency factor YidD n=1 Tax=Nocardia sp. TaxID=1821 RepID=UPI002B4B09C8|nr:membrane protein insertion efficiency factor YidD [Nocardia sp.]HLS78538.1 membrane protein insertion efficiency factor YidD [Nocardia sp.]
MRSAVAAVTRLPARALIFLIELYRTYVSPTRMPVCRFTPTCSEYAVTALRTRGLVVGLGLAAVRLLKCAPWHPGGWDPVPGRRPRGRNAAVADDSSAPDACKGSPHAVTNDGSA